MSDWYKIEVEMLDISIPKGDFPLKSDVIVGYKYPNMLYSEDEGSYEHICGTGDPFGRPMIRFNKSKFYMRDNYATIFEEIADIAERYGGTLIANLTSEEGETEYIRIRDGKQKKVRIVEED